MQISFRTTGLASVPVRPTSDLILLATAPDQDLLWHFIIFAFVLLHLKVCIHTRVVSGSYSAA